MGFASAATGSERVARRVGAQAPVLRTLLGDLPPERMPSGAILFHEHLSFKYPLGSPTHVTDDVELMIRETRAAQGEGVAAIVDGGHVDMDRNLTNLRRIATETGMPVIASGGYYMESSYPDRLATMTAQQIADELVAEAGRDRLGALGEIGQQGAEMTATERKVFEAIGLTSARTGLPIFTHNPYSMRATTVPRDAALRQLAILEGAGADLAHICIGHVCCLDDPQVEIASEIARRGSYVGFDRVGLNATMPDANRVTMAMALVERGHADKILLSSDFYSGRQLKANGGVGLALTVTQFGPMLTAAGLPAATLRMILEENPRRFLAFVPRA
jgi:phosphotriesterase-related protein